MYVGFGGETFLALPVKLPTLCNMAVGEFETSQQQK